MTCAVAVGGCGQLLPFELTGCKAKTAILSKALRRVADDIRTTYYYHYKRNIVWFEGRDHMELTVGKADLQKELQLCQGVVEKRSTIPILSNVLLKAADGRLQIAATDLDVTILSSCAARVTTPGGVTIEAKRLFDVVRSLPDEDVHITLQENNSMLIESGTAKFRLLGLAGRGLPDAADGQRRATRTRIPLDELKTMVGKVKFAITHEETRFQLNGALLKVQPNKMEMVATDGHRMALINFPVRRSPAARERRARTSRSSFRAKRSTRSCGSRAAKTAPCSSASPTTSSSSKPATAACWRA